MILKLKPLIQKCTNGEDDVIPLERRDFKNICNKLNVDYNQFLANYNLFNNKDGSE